MTNTDAQPARPLQGLVSHRQTEKCVPTSFDFGGTAIKPDYVVKCSYGNDSIALLQYLHEYDQKHPLGKVVVLYNKTRFASSWWDGRVANGEKLVAKYGWIPCQTDSKGMMQLIIERKAWPDSQMRFCTEELKIIPTLNWLAIHDTDGEATMVCGVRREESTARALWPEWASGDEGRDQWSPLIYHTAAQRDELIVRAGWIPLKHRSRECKCVLGNSTDLKSWREDDIVTIDGMEKELGKIQKGVNRFMFRPHKMKGKPEGIRAVIEWAKKVKTKEPASGGCDSGYCTG